MIDLISRDGSASAPTLPVSSHTDTPAVPGAHSMPTLAGRTLCEQGAVFRQD